VRIRALYSVPEAMSLLNLSRTQIYELIRTARLVTVTQGRGRLVPAESSRTTCSCWPSARQAGMATRRSYGEGGLSWNERRQRWVGRASLGYGADGKRRIGTVSAKTKSEARAKLRTLLRDHEDGLPTAQSAYTVRDAVEACLEHGLVGRDPHTVENRTSLARTHVIQDLGKRRLIELTAEEVDHWLTGKAHQLSSDTLQRLLSILRQSIRRAGPSPATWSSGTSPCCVTFRRDAQDDRRSR
jgi:hypothetical protein